MKIFSVAVYLHIRQTKQQQNQKTEEKSLADWLLNIREFG